MLLHSFQDLRIIKAAKLHRIFKLKSTLYSTKRRLELTIQGMCANEELTIQILNITSAKIVTSTMSQDRFLSQLWKHMPRVKKNPAATPNQPAITNQLFSAHAASTFDISTERAMQKDNTL